MKEAPQGTIGLTSANGWIDSGLFLEWLKHFQKHINSSGANKHPILDNHCSYLSLSATEFARVHGIIMLSVPPHADCCHSGLMLQNEGTTFQIS